MFPQCFIKSHVSFYGYFLLMHTELFYFDRYIIPKDKHSLKKVTTRFMEPRGSMPHSQGFFSIFSILSGIHTTSHIDYPFL